MLQVRPMTMASPRTERGGLFGPAGTPWQFNPSLPPTVEAGVAITVHTEGEISSANFCDLRDV